MSKKRAFTIGHSPIFFLIFGLLAYFILSTHTHAQSKAVPWWTFQSIDTMKYSRDVAREKLTDPNFKSTINQQIKAIAQTGATHVAIATPYDEEFVPFLKLWVTTAREYGLNVWFRGNWSGWEKWFGYALITREQHIQKTREFILTHPNLFSDGDVFTACPECENGGPGDPRYTEDIIGYRQFLISEYQVVKKSFVQIHKQVQANFDSTNGDVARAVMDKETTKALDGLVVIDHYVASSDNLVKDIKDLAGRSGGQIILGEFGAPIPDIHGNLNEEEQAKWIDQALTKLAQTNLIGGISYWTNVGSSTELWQADGKAKKVVQVIKKFYTPRLVTGQVVDQFKKPIANASVTTKTKNTHSDKSGNFSIPVLNSDTSLVVSHGNYQTQEVTIPSSSNELTVIFQTDHLSFWQKLLLFLQKLFKRG